jgi:hypothetical protein
MDLINVAETVNGTDLNADRKMLALLENIGRETGSNLNRKLNDIKEREQMIRNNMIDRINKKAKVKVEELWKISGLGKVIVASTLTDIVITDLRTPDGKFIGIRSCEDLHGQNNWLGQHVPPNERIMIAYKNDGVKEGDVLGC